MPTKQWLLDNFDSASAIINYAAANHGTSLTLKYVKRLANGQVEVLCCDEINGAETYTGTGADKRDAVASCISAKFPA